MEDKACVRNKTFSNANILTVETIAIVLTLGQVKHQFPRFSFLTYLFSTYNYMCVYNRKYIYKNEQLQAATSRLDPETIFKRHLDESNFTDPYYVVRVSTS